MKRILITVLITIFCFGIGATSFAVNDLSNLNDWYQNEVKPVTEQNHHKIKKDSEHKEKDVKSHNQKKDKHENKKSHNENLEEQHATPSEDTQTAQPMNNQQQSTGTQITTTNNQ